MSEFEVFIRIIFGSCAVLETSVASSWFTDYPERWSIVFFPDLF
jgi:hypothetical protein